MGLSFEAGLGVSIMERCGGKRGGKYVKLSPLPPPDKGLIKGDMDMTFKRSLS